MSRKFPGFRILFMAAALGLLAVGASHWQRQAISQEKAPAAKPARGASGRAAFGRLSTCVGSRHAQRGDRPQQNQRARRQAIQGESSSQARRRGILSKERRSRTFSAAKECPCRRPMAGLARESVRA